MRWPPESADGVVLHPHIPTDLSDGTSNGPNVSFSVRVDALVAFPRRAIAEAAAGTATTIDSAPGNMCVTIVTELAAGRPQRGRHGTRQGPQGASLGGRRDHRVQIPQTRIHCMDTQLHNTFLVVDSKGK